MSRAFSQKTVSECSKTSHFQHKASCKTSFICMRIKKNHFHINGYALNLALKQRLGLTQKRRIVWPIKTVVENSIHQSELEATLTCTGAERGKAHATKSRLFLLFTIHRSRGFNQSTVLRHGSEETSNFFSWRSCDVMRYLEDATILAARSDLDLEAVFVGN